MFRGKDAMPNYEIPVFYRKKCKSTAEMKERNVQLVRIDSGDDVSYHCVGESKNNCVEIYEGVLPSLIDHLLENQVQLVLRHAIRKCE